MRQLALWLILLAPLSAASVPIQVNDDQGEVITLAQPARRIVALSAHLVENLHLIGAGDALIGRVAYADYPPQAINVPIVGDSAGINLETIMALKPDLVLAWSGGNRAAQLAQLRSLGIPVFNSDPQSFEEMAHLLEQLGVIVGRQREGRAQAAALRTAVRKLFAQSPPAPPVRVFYQLWPAPLFTLGEKSAGWIHEIFRRCGGQEIFPHLRGPAPVLSREVILSANPEIIFVADHDDHWRQWPLAASVITIDGNVLNRPVPRMLQAAQEVCRAIHSVRRHQPG